MTINDFFLSKFKPESKKAETSKAGEKDANDHHNIGVPATYKVHHLNLNLNLNLNSNAFLQRGESKF